jgi:hypothetical protein
MALIGGVFIRREKISKAGHPKIVLAYCIVEAHAEVKVPAAGVEGALIRPVRIGALRCFVSDLSSPVEPDSLPGMAKAFQGVLQRIFAENAIIPFRFPTVVESERELMQFVESRSGEYREALQRLRGKLQMDIRIVAEPRRNRGTVAGTELSRRSGKEYLRAKSERRKEVEAALKVLRRAAGSQVDQWIERDTASGMRAFALLSRSSLPGFVEKLRQVHTPAGTSTRVTGPWPPSEFVEINDEEVRENSTSAE